MRIGVRQRAAYAYTGGRRFDAAQPTVVFVHGADHDHSVWNLQSRYVAHHGSSVLAVDLPGHGRSEGPPLARVEDMAAWLMALLDACGVGRASLVGHSMGSLVALEAAAAHPERIERAALLGTAAPMPVSDRLLNAARNDESAAENMVNIWSHGARGHLGGNTIPGMWMLATNRRLMARAQRGVLFNDLSACNAYRNAAHAATRVRCPALVIAGGRDQMTSPKSARVLADAIRGARLAMIEDSGHALMAEFPDAVLDLLRDFLLS